MNRAPPCCCAVARIFSAIKPSPLATRLARRSPVSSAGPRRWVGDRSPCQTITSRIARRESRVSRREASRTRSGLTPHVRGHRGEPERRQFLRQVAQPGFDDRPRCFPLDIESHGEGLWLRDDARFECRRRLLKRRRPRRSPDGHPAPSAFHSLPRLPVPRESDVDRLFTEHEGNGDLSAACCRHLFGDDDAAAAGAHRRTLEPGRAPASRRSSTRRAEAGRRRSHAVDRP